MFPTASSPNHDPLSLWQQVSPPRQSAPPLSGTIDADVTIIGGGFTGLSAALHLAKSGRQVCLLEGKTIGWGGSGRNNGQVIPVLSGAEPDQIEARYGEAGERLVSLVADSADFLFKLARQENIDCEAEQTGWFQPAHSPGHFAISEKRNAAWQKRGASSRLLDAKECQQLLGSKAWYGGMFNHTGGHINPLMLARGLATACEKAGVTIYENTPVVNIQKTTSGWSVKTAAGSVKAKAVLLTTNAYSNELSSSLEPKIARSVVPVTSWQMSTEPLCDELQVHILPGRQAVSDTRGDLQFFRYDARNRLVSGAALMIPLNAAKRLSDMVGKRLQTAFPQLGKPDFTHIWSGYVGVMPDHLPHFHQPGPDYWAAIGYNGRGVALAVSIGRELANAVNGADMKDLALPLSNPKPVPVHPVSRRVARTALVYYRYRDHQKPKV